MNPFKNEVEELILKAIERGEFNNLPGAGKPLSLEDDLFVPDDMKMAYRVLKNAKVVPQEVGLLQEVLELKKQLASQKLTADQKQELEKKLNFKQCEAEMALERARSRCRPEIEP